MPTLYELELTYQGEPLDNSPDLLGPLRESSEAVNDREELWRRWEEDGYLFLPGYLDRQQVKAGRESILERVAAVDELNRRSTPINGIVRPGPTVAYASDIMRDNRAVNRVLHEGPMVEFYEFFLGGPVRYFDFTWFRAKTSAAGTATQPHCDMVYMSRGTKQLCTSWTPFGDIPVKMGGLMMLERSHKNREFVEGYGQTDVDAYCETEDADVLVRQARQEDRDLTGAERDRIRWNSSGSYSVDAIEVRREFGGRWLTADYRMGDLLVFCMHLLHASHDNQTDELRISTDTRYQLASEPVDERWIGDDPPGHSIRAKRGIIC